MVRLLVNAGADPLIRDKVSISTLNGSSLYLLFMIALLQDGEVAVECLKRTAMSEESLKIRQLANPSLTQAFCLMVSLAINLFFEFK